ncbi:MAG: hypothetical protein ABSH50_26465 [Bryobacteraceae bacterium]|jgi:hypothetical protein
MKGTIAFLRQSPGLRFLAPRPAGQPPLEVIVPYNNPALAARALCTAFDLARGFEAVVTLIAVYVLPYPAQLECQEGIRQRLEAELTRVVHAVPAAVRVKLVFARSREDAYLGLLPRRSMVVMAAPDRWWPTQEERLARKLAAAGHSVAVIRVK